MTKDEVIALLEEKYGLTGTIAAIKERLSLDAHHKHRLYTSGGQETDMKTGEPEGKAP